MVLEFLVIEPGASAVEPGEGPPSAGSKELPYGPPGQTSLLGRDVPSSRRTLPTRDCRHRTRPQGREKPEFQAQSWKTSWRQHGSQCSPHALVCCGDAHVCMTAGLAADLGDTTALLLPSQTASRTASA